MPSLGSYNPKQLRATLTIADDNCTVFAGTNSNTLVLTGLRMSATVNAIQQRASELDLKIYGMLPADMNALTVMFFTISPQALPNNTVMLEANNGDGWRQIFEGTIIAAQPEYGGAPDVYFQIQGIVGGYHKLLSVPPLSFPGSVSAANIIEQLATQMGFVFENNGVTTQLSNPYLPGTAFDQFLQVVQACRIDWYIEGNTLAICPANALRANVPLVVLSPTSGLIGYPRIERFATLVVNCLFNPGIIGGGNIQIQDSAIPAANGMWNPISVTHTLESAKPDGAWFSQLQCIRVLGASA